MMNKSILEITSGYSLFTPTLLNAKNSYIPTLSVLYTDDESSIPSFSNAYLASSEFSRRSCSEISDFDLISSEIISYKNLDDDWDGYGGIAPDEPTLSLAFNFLSELQMKGCFLPKTMVSGSGAISFYWERKYEDFYMEIEFDNTGGYSFFIDHNNGVIGQDNINFHRDGILDKISSKIKKIENILLTIAA